MSLRTQDVSNEQLKDIIKDQWDFDWDMETTLPVDMTLRLASDFGIIINQ